MKILSQMEQYAREAGEIILSAHDILSKTQEKTSAADLVTAYDLKVEEFLKEKLPPITGGAVFFGEEEQEQQDASRGWAFIVDPIDGTTNFVRGLHQSCVSIALAKDAEVQYAVVYNPYSDELFSAKRGCGACCNGKPIHVSTRPLDQGIFTMGTAIYYREFVKPTLSLTAQLLDRSCDFRRSGSAAIDLCTIAAGRSDLFFEYKLSPWDYAAGSLMVTEAGGRIGTLDGKPLPIIEKSSVWASNAVNFDILKELDV